MLKHVVTGGLWGRGWKEEIIITHLTLGHRKLNYTLHKTGRQPTRVRTQCDQLQSLQLVLLESSEGNYSSIISGGSKI